MPDPFRRIRAGLAAFACVIAGGTLGFWLLGRNIVDAIYMTVITVSTVGFGTEEPLTNAGKIVVVCLILVGTGIVLYTFTVALEVLIEGHMRDLVRRRRMATEIRRMDQHVIICGWGRVGAQVARFLERSGQELVVVDRNADRIDGISYPHVSGDVTEDETLSAAGIERASTLVAALDTDSDNLFVTVAGRGLKPDLHIIARARNESSEGKLLRAGANRVVNPQRLGGDRMAAFVTQPHVADFVDFVMHDGTFEVRLEEVRVAVSSVLDGESLRSARVHERTGALVLAMRNPDGSFSTNPGPQTTVSAGDVLISVGTSEQLVQLRSLAAGAAGSAGSR